MLRPIHFNDPDPGETSHLCRSMKLIGLTGGMGSGKSTIAEIFKTLHVPVYDSDARARTLMNTSPELREHIQGLFGPEAYTTDQGINRAYIASKVFKDPELLRQLNAIVHPAVFQDLVSWAQEPAQLDAPYLVQESAILFEAALHSRFTAVVLVIAPMEVRIERVMQRDHASRESVMDRMQNQWPDAEKLPYADYVIYNDGARSLISQVTEIDRMIRITG